MLRLGTRVTDLQTVNFAAVYGNADPVTLIDAGLSSVVVNDIIDAGLSSAPVTNTVDGNDA